MAIDLHNDTIPMLDMGGIHGDLARNDGMLDLEKMRRGDFQAAFFSLFLDAQAVENPYQKAQALYTLFEKQMTTYADQITHVRDFNDYLKAKEAQKLAAFLTLEGGEALVGDLTKLTTFYEQGVRLLTLTWNYENELAYPNGDSRGLNPFGRDVIAHMNDLGMLIDVSHLSDAGFDEVATLSQQPFIASHSNARAITNHPRNLDDQRIKTLANAGGVMGLNFCRIFLTDDPKKATVADMVRHVQHIIQVGGEEVIALGSDFDGIPREVEIDDASQLDRLIAGLLHSGLHESVVDKLLFGNAERVIKAVL